LNSNCNNSKIFSVIVRYSLLIEGEAKGSIEDTYPSTKGETIISERWIDEIGLYILTLKKENLITEIKYPINRINKVIVNRQDNNGLNQNIESKDTCNEQINKEQQNKCADRIPIFKK
jgi:hypothetical protein